MEQAVLNEEVERILDRYEKPKPLPGIIPYYAREDSKIPEKIRISFSDGSTAVYDLRVQQLSPQIVENVTIIRKWGKDRYVNKPRRRRSRK